ncbi:MAG: hypothetical protein LBR64_09430 [Dysgonamonadaceae bacterium]|nr:hypothetical protein [Dysgonamonadaceae bacterium]
MSRTAKRRMAQSKS